MLVEVGMQIGVLVDNQDMLVEGTTMVTQRFELCYLSLCIRTQRMWDSIFGCVLRVCVKEYTKLIYIQSRFRLEVSNDLCLFYLCTRVDSCKVNVESLSE